MLRSMLPICSEVFSLCLHDTDPALYKLRNEKNFDEKKGAALPDSLNQANLARCLAAPQEYLKEIFNMDEEKGPIAESPEHGRIRQCCSTLVGPGVKKMRFLGVIALVGAGIALAIGLASNTGWLVAIGATPIVLALLPCILMCIIGFVAFVGLSLKNVSSARTRPEKNTPITDQSDRRVL